METFLKELNNNTFSNLATGVHVLKFNNRESSQTVKVIKTIILKT